MAGSADPRPVPGSARGQAASGTRGQSSGAKGHQTRPLDAVDGQIIQLLMSNGRMSNAALAAATGTAESTSHARVQALRDQGVITGVHAEVDTAAVGRPLQALIFVRIHPGMRDELASQAERLSRLPSVLEVLFLGGQVDFVLWVAVSGPDELRRIILDDLNSHKAIAGTETSVVLESRRGDHFAPIVAG